LDSSILNYEQSRIVLDKSVDDAKRALELAEYGFGTTERTAEQSLKQAKQGLENASLVEGSQSRLSLNKMVLDIQNQITNLKLQFSVQKSQLINLLNDVLHQADNLLGVTTTYKQGNDSFDVYLGAKNSQKKQEARMTLLNLYKIRNDILSLETQDLNNSKLKEQVFLLSEPYHKIESFLVLMQEVLRYSTTSSSFSALMVDRHIASFDGLEAARQVAYTQFVLYENQVVALLADVVDVGSDQEQVADIAQQQIEIILKNAEETEKSAKIAWETANIGVENSLFNAEM